MQMYGVKAIICLFLAHCAAFELNADCYLITEDGLEDYAAYQIQEWGIHLPDTLIMPPGAYVAGDSQYNCYKEGLYRYYDIGSYSTQRIVYDGNIERLLHSLTWVQAHGYRDDSLPFSSSLSISLTGRLHMTCGSFAQFVNCVCQKVGVDSRTVLFLTLDEWNSYNNGHSLNEIKINGKWQLWDLDLRKYFTRNGCVFNALGFRDAMADNDYEIVHFSQSPLLATGDLRSSCCSSDFYDYSFFFERLLSEKILETFYKKSTHVILIQDNDGCFDFTCDEADIDRIKSYNASFRYMSGGDFINKYYW